MRRYVLNATMPVLLRPDNTVQIGWDPRRAILVRPPDGLTARALAELLRTMHSGATLADLQAQAVRRGIDHPDSVAELVTALIQAGVVSTVARHHTRAASVRIHGRGPLSDLLANGLRCSGARVQRTATVHPGPVSESTDLMVLADYLATDPRLVRELHAAGVAHLPVRVRDGTGLIGPLVLPGVTSCLDCADLHRSDRDAAWPAVAAQLRDTVGSADRATLLATAALALDQVDRVIRAVHGRDDGDGASDPPPTLNTTLEFDVRTHAILSRRWSRHPRCHC